MSLQHKIIPGLAVEIEVLEGEYKGKYRSHVDEVGQTRVSIYSPTEKGATIPLHEGTKILLSYVDDSAAYLLKTFIIQRISQPVAIFVLELTDSIQRVQRRNFVRVPASYPIVYQVVDGNRIGETNIASMLDLSGGGLCFQTEESLKNDDILHVIMKLPSEEIKIQGKICRVRKIEDTKFFAVSVAFAQITEKERDRVIHQVFKIQRDLRKKGLI